MSQFRPSFGKIAVFFIFVILISFAHPFAASAHDDTTNVHKKIVQRVEEGINKGDLTGFDVLFAPDFVNQGISPKMGITEFKAYLSTIRDALPDFQSTTEVMIAEGDIVASRLIYSGTFKNPLVQPDGNLAPNGKPIKWALNVFYRFDKDDKIVEMLTAYDQLDLLTQFGASSTNGLLSLIGRPKLQSIKVVPAKTLDLESAHKEVFQRFVEKALNQGELDVMDEILSADYIGHDPFANLDRASFKQVIGKFREIVPDLHVTADILIAEGDWTAARLIYRGTFKNKIALPFVAIEPTNKPVQFIINVFAHIDEKGQATEDWKEFNRLVWLQQVGVLPTS
ncbi:MAG: ester cyclase family protein [Chloroflexota bacterium]